MKMKEVNFEQITRDMNAFANTHPEFERNEEEFKLICMMYAAMKQGIENV